MTRSAGPRLLEAYGPSEPGAAVHPGPRANDWSALGAASAGGSEDMVLAREVLDALLAPRGPHRREDGTATSIQRRGVPSAGASYGLRAHVLEPAPEGEWLRWVYDPEPGTLRLRSPASERLLTAAESDTAASSGLWRQTVAAGSGAVSAAPGSVPECRAADPAGSPTRPGAIGSSLLVFSVLPGRAFSRYRHRAWPLWLADVAYAAAGAEHLLGTTAALASRLPGGAAGLRHALAWPRCSHAGAWLSRGLAPELPLAVVPLPAARPSRLTQRAQRLGTRRSPAPARFRSPTRGGAVEARRLAAAARQSWIAGADRVLTWTLDVPAATPGVLLQGAWDAPLAAARRLYAEHADGSWVSRPVSGIVAASGTWVVHALASLRPDRPATHGGIRT